MLLSSVDHLWDVSTLWMEKKHTWFFHRWKRHTVHYIRCHIWKCVDMRSTPCRALSAVSRYIDSNQRPVNWIHQCRNISEMINTFECSCQCSKNSFFHFVWLPWCFKKWNYCAYRVLCDMDTHNRVSFKQANNLQQKCGVWLILAKWEILSR